MQAPSHRELTKSAEKRRLKVNAENRKILSKIKALLKTDDSEKTDEDLRFLNDHSHVVEELSVRKIRSKQAADKLVEFEEDDATLEKKCQILSDAIKQADHAVVYTGAGISTAAAIPDYRGPNGIWTKLSQGVSSTYDDLSNAQPTLTHMVLAEMLRQKQINHIVSQNCDGLHVRSGVPSDALSEVHGNMYAELCLSCSPQRLYWRCHDVTEATRLRRHKTMRYCHCCREQLVDTIVHFGEKRALEWPQNWQNAIDNAKKTDLILCLGSSLKVLKSYHSLWCMDRKGTDRPKLFIVNLQWTPKDKSATLKINGRCDSVMTLIAKHLGITIPHYDRENDPLLKMCSPLTPNEMKTFSTLPINSTAPITPSVDIKRESCQMPHDDPSDSASQTSDNKNIGCGPGWFGKGYKKRTRKPSRSKKK